MFREMHSDSLYKHFHAGYFQHPHLGLTGDDHIVGAAGRPYLPGLLALPVGIVAMIAFLYVMKRKQENVA